MGTRKGSSPNSPSGKAEAKRKALGRPSGKPPKIIDYQALEKMSALGMTHKSMAVLLGIHACQWSYWIEKDPNFAKAYKEGRGKGEQYLLGSLMELVKKKNLGAIIFSLKAVYGYREKITVTHTGDAENPIKHSHAHMTEEEIDEKIKELARRSELFSQNTIDVTPEKTKK